MKLINSRSTGESWRGPSGDHAGQGEKKQQIIRSYSGYIVGAPGYIWNQQTATDMFSQVSILASQAPTNPDLDVEEEAAERQSLAGGAAPTTNGTTPADLQLSCESCSIFAFKN